MTIEEVKKKIKSRGYWEINFYPVRFIADRIPNRPACKEIIRKTAINLTGWDFPHVPTHNNEDQKMYSGPDYVEAYVDWEQYKEAWRFYQSGQFIHYLGLRADWWEESTSIPETIKKIKPKSILPLTGTLCRVTEIFEFLKRLSMQDLYNEGVKINIKLVGIRDRKLSLLDSRRIPLSIDYIAHVSEITLPTKELTKDEILTSSREIALKNASYIFGTFNWENQPIKMFEADQLRLLERRL